jgi:hypothetical protein
MLKKKEEKYGVLKHTFTKKCDDFFWRSGDCDIIIEGLRKITIPLQVFANRNNSPCLQHVMLNTMLEGQDFQVISMER